MSNVKLYLPFYDKNILLDILSMINKYDNVMAVHVSQHYNKDSKKMYKNLCDFIFNNPETLIILIGQYTDYLLPIPHNCTKLITGIREDKHKYYPMGAEITSSELSKKLERYLCVSLSSATFENKIEGKKFNGDAFQLLYETNFNKHKKEKLHDVILKVFDIENIEDFENQKLWGKVTYKNVHKHDHHIYRVKNADLSYPIIVYKDKKSKQYRLLDGFHRLVKSYMLGKETININFVTLAQIKKTKLTAKAKDKKTRKTYLTPKSATTKCSNRDIN